MNLDYQLDKAQTHMDKAVQCIEYGRPDDADVHIRIAMVLLKEAKKAQTVRDYEQDSLSNLASVLS
jgi:hypothetical protein